MSVMQSENNPDDEFRRLTESLGVMASEPTDVVDVTTLDNVALLALLQDTVNELFTIGEATVTNDRMTPQGRDLHSVRTAALVEVARRGLR